MSLTFISGTEQRSRDGRRMALYLCHCGREKPYPVGRVAGGYVRSCGCAVGAVKPNLQHGQRHNAVYRSWLAAKRRCLNPDDKDYPRYGARGITFCAEWARSFSAFYAHVGDRPEGTTIDRIDPLRGYEPGNVRWATPHEQSRNRQDLTIVNTPQGTMPLVDYAARIGITNGAAHLRLRRGKLEGVTRE